jgi:hypothetical protein
MRVGAPKLKQVAGVERRALGAAGDIEREVERVLSHLRGGRTSALETVRGLLRASRPAARPPAPRGRNSA